MKKPEQVPDKVKEAIENYNRQHPEANLKEEELQWDGLMGCYSFERSGMYHGVELDGYIHT